MAQRTVYLPAADLAMIDGLAAAAPEVVDRATFWRWSIVIGAQVLDSALKEIKPSIMAPLAISAILKTKAGRKLIKIEAASEDELTE